MPGSLSQNAICYHLWLFLFLKRNIITMSLSSLRVNFCNYNASLGQMCENGRLIPARIFLFFVHFQVWCYLLIRVALFALVKGYVSVSIVNL